ncbi:GreA/GreB family elongation factor [bacterium]|jgi:transcription elongation GreA/GreB family factor|nr:GreA/GreB family elongation factor [Verrucomicrobiota bacterium]MDB4628350.1 GreA/GreB family elongation factor [bacterium]MDA7653947.1 GreA/GreB family elongation factor [Verrucomicrobiota bacterium]MDB4705180.1 GreA/GreB family elongation factor [Verrucomicrobiota bacterium]MDB4795238.1 GreA/GreB family elongation factor [Verrucomicrobiota bacterium]
MREEFEKLASEGKIRSKDLDALEQLTESGYCTHRTWGLGKITTVDTVFSRFLIDFPDKTGHSMDLGFSAKSLTPLAKDHVLVKVATDLDGLKQMAAVSHMDLIKLVLKSHGGKATVAQIQAALVPEVIEEDWRKWWEAVRKELKKDGHFRVPVKKSDPIEFNEEVTSLQERLLGDIRAARGLKAKLAVANEVLKSQDDLENVTEAFEESMQLLDGEIPNYIKNQPELVLDAIFTRNDLREGLRIEAVEGQIEDIAVWDLVEDLPAFMDALAATRNKRTLRSYKQHHEEKWEEDFHDLLNNAQMKLVGEIVNLLIDEDRHEGAKETLLRLVNQHQASSEMLLWLGKTRSDAFADILGPEVFRAMITAMERDQFNEKKTSRLNDFIMGDQELIPELIETADLEVVKDLTRALQFSSCFDDMDKRSLLGRIVKCYPAIQALISGEQSASEDRGLLVSWDSLLRRRGEYGELVQKKIPENSKEIAIARSYGDLRENHEYKAAKEMQKLLMKRKSELEADLTRARGTDFSAVQTDVVNPGTLVKVTDLTNKKEETYTILGAWDSEPEDGIISYLSPLANILIGKKPGDEVDLEQDQLVKKYRLNSIASHEYEFKHHGLHDESGQSVPLETVAE